MRYSRLCFVLQFILFFCSFCCLMSCSFRAICLLLRTLFFFYPPALFSSRNNSGWAGQSWVAASSCLLRHKGPGCPPARATCCSSHWLETKPASSPPSFADRSVTTLDCLQSKLHCKGLHVHSSVTVVIDSFPCLRIHCGKVCGGDGEREGRRGDRGSTCKLRKWSRFSFFPLWNQYTQDYKSVVTNVKQVYSGLNSLK